MHKLTEDGKAKLRQVAKFLAENPNRFDMNHVFANQEESLPPCEFDFNDCGTTMCIAGAVEAFFDPDFQKLRFSPCAVRNAMTILSGEFDDDLNRLFMAYPDEESSLPGLNSNNVIEAIEIFIESGIDGVETFLGCSLRDRYL